MTVSVTSHVRATYSRQIREVPEAHHVDRGAELREIFDDPRCRGVDVGGHHRKTVSDIQFLWRETPIRSAKACSNITPGG